MKIMQLNHCHKSCSKSTEHHEFQIYEDGIRCVFFYSFKYHVHEVGSPLFSVKGILGSIIAFIVLYEARQVYRNLLVATLLDAVSCFVPCVRQA